MTTASLTTDRWVVCSPDLYTALRDEWAPLLRSQWFSLRFASNSVESATLADLHQHLSRATVPAASAVHLVFDRIGAAEIAAIGHLPDRLSALLRLHDWSADPQAVLAGLCTPAADQVQAFLAAAKPTEPALAAAMAQWQSAVARRQAETADPDGEDDGWNFRWATPIALAADTTVNHPPELVPVFTKQTGDHDGSLRWYALLAGIAGDAISIHLTLHPVGPRKDETMSVRFSIAKPLLPAPDRLRLASGDGSQVLAEFGPLYWDPDPVSPDRAQALVEQVVTADQARTIRSLMSQSLWLHAVVARIDGDDEKLAA
jgi:hypothetical protein